MASTTTTTAPPPQFAFRTLKEIGLTDAAPLYAAVPGFTRPQGNSRCCIYSPCGRYFAWAAVEGVHVVDSATGSPVADLPVPNVYELAFSPRGSYVITWERPSKDEAGDAVKNLKVWRTIEEGERTVLGRWVQKSQTGWNLQYTADEKYCARVVTNEVQFYESHELAVPWNRLRAEGVADFALSPGNNNSVAVFIPQRKGQPAAVKVFNVPQFGTAVSQKTFFKGDKVQLKWNALGTTLIVLAQTETDKTGKSYYGETTLYVLSANGGFDSRITLDKEGPIHDVTWSPNSREFGVVYGYMPAKTTIFNTRAVATHSFPLGPRNTILFSPTGRFVLVAGFGNLAGQVDVYDLSKDYRKITTIESGNPSVCEWSPDERFLLTATTSPRLRVDNGIRIFHVSGSIVYNEDMVELYHVAWRPSLPGPNTVSNPLAPVPQHSSAAQYLTTVKTPSKPAGAYRPPGARGTSTPLHFKREDEGGAAHTVSNGTSLVSAPVFGHQGPRARRAVPGAELVEATPAASAEDENLSKAALKNKKKREAKKAKEAEIKAGGGAPTVPPGFEGVAAGGQGQRANGNANGNANGDRRAGRNTPAAATAAPSTPARNRAPAPAAAVPVPEPVVVVEEVLSPGGGSAHAKKLRGLQKKMRAIEELEMRLAGGERLEDTQMRKIGTKASVVKELEGLEVGV
ncbi:hypothetical protein V499_03667 [Pseudogymnoascus sp. VKM F-103]|nr:hypothetical protein V499_03667 [Pseudogymnoascus sp. VKM F-103]